MNRKTVINTLLTISISFLISCEGKKRINAISKIEIASDGGERQFNGHVLTLDSSLNSFFYGGSAFKRSGYFKGRISLELWHQINEKLEQADYKTAPLSDNVHTPDVEYFEVIVYSGAYKKRFVRCSCGKKTQLTQVFKWILENHALSSMEKTKDFIKFSTTYQNPPRTPPNRDSRHIPLYLPATY